MNFGVHFIKKATLFGVQMRQKLNKMVSVSGKNTLTLVFFSI